MRKTRASQASSSEKLLRLKQELATTAELVNGVLKREQLKREASQQAKAVWEKREDFANLKRKFPSLLNAKEDEELFYDKERVKKVKPEQVYVWQCFLRVRELKPGFCSRIGGVKLKTRDNNGDLMSPVSHEAIVRPKERAAAILAQVDREMARIRERDHHWEDGMEVSCFLIAFPISTHHRVECISTSVCFSSSTTFQVVPPARDISIIIKIQHE